MGEAPNAAGMIGLATANKEWAEDAGQVNKPYPDNPTPAMMQKAMQGKLDQLKAFTELAKKNACPQVVQSVEVFNVLMQVVEHNWLDYNHTKLWVRLPDGKIRFYERNSFGQYTDVTPPENIFDTHDADRAI